MHDPADKPIPLWPLPAAIALLFIVAAHLGLWLSIRGGHVDACTPLVEGCTSISRAARHGLANHVFRLLVLPCALLVGLHWWLAARRLGSRWRDVAWLGGIAALALAVYATFLGTDGEAYRFLRRYGVVCFFGFGYLAQLRFLHAIAGAGQSRDGIVRAMLVVSALMLLLGWPASRPPPWSRTRPGRTGSRTHWNGSWAGCWLRGTACMRRCGAGSR